MARGRIYQQKHILKDANGQPIISPDGKPKYKLRSENWWISYYDANGKRHYESANSKKKGDAERLLNLKLGAKEKGEPVGAQIGKITFDDAVKAVIEDHTINSRRSTAREQGRIDNHLTPYFTGRRMVNITGDVIRAYVVARQAVKATGATINRELQILKRAFRLAHRDGKLLHVPYVPKLHESEARRGFFERAEFEVVREQLPEHIRPLLTFYYFTGWRNKEALTLEVRQVNLDDGVVMLDAAQSKNKQPRSFFFSALDELRDVLTEQLASAERLTRARSKIVTAVFHTPSGEPIKDSDFRKAWVSARKAAGYPGKLIHDFRRTAARNLVRAGVPETVAMKLTGHQTRSMFDRYNITSGEDLRAAGELLQAFSMGKPKDGKKGARVRQFRKRG